MNDLRFAGRIVRKNPLFAGAAVVTIALGLGAATSIFSVMDAVLLRRLPYPRPERLVLAGPGMFSNADFFDLRQAAKSLFEEVAGVSTFRAFVPRGDGSTEQVSRALATGNFLGMLGARVALGRLFTPGDGDPQLDEPGVLLSAGSAAILSYEYWQRRYGGDAGVLGREMLSSGGRGPRIVGVLAPRFRLYFPPNENIDAAPDFWVANNLGYDGAHRNLMTLRAAGRLREAIPVKAAQTLLDSLARELRKNNPDWGFGRPIRLEQMHAHLVAEVRPAIVALMGSATFLLLIACANVANLILARAGGRSRELAVRTAVGGSKGRLVRQMLVEAALLSGLGTLLGIVLATLAARLLPAIAPENLPRIEAVAIDWRAVSFAAVAGLVATGLFGTLPAWRAARPDVMQSLRGSADASSKAGRRSRIALTVAEVALSFVLLTGAGLLFRSFLALRRIDPGYDPHGVLTFLVARQWPISRQEGRQALLRNIQNRLRALPGVRNAAAAVSFPLAPGPRPAGTPPEPRPVQPTADGADFEFVLPGYFETLRTPLLAGRTFTEQDNVPGRRVAIIDELLARKAFPSQSPIGKRIRVPWPDTPWVEVIGVVAHQRAATLADPGREAIFFADGFDGIGVSRRWAIRTGADPAKYAQAVRSEIARIDKHLVISQVQPMTALVDRDQAGRRFDLLLLSVFAAIAALLALVGIYGVLATLVQQRTPEIGIRIALGAAPAGIFKLVAGHGLRLSAAGIAIGLATALALTKAMTSMLVGVTPNDPLTLAGTAILFLLAGGTACWIPARRASRLDPSVALRDE